MKHIFFYILFSLLFIQLLVGQQATVLKVGDTAPNFTLPYATKDSVSRGKITLSDITVNQKVILAFYPADWSGGCTKEVCSLRDNFKSLADLNTEVIAISGDYIFSHHEWAKFHNLPFKLLSDHDHSIAKTYSSYNSEHGYNKRTVYVIDVCGKILYIDLNYSVADEKSFKQLRTALEGLSK
ncbi:MAG: peroxiredoxin [Ignavibacteriales bacterium]|nr:peroxiredoxin [Ignavibacteriales bacterium]